MAEAKKKKSTKVVGRRAMKAADFAALSTGGELPMDENAKMRKEIEELEEKCREERRTVARLDTEIGERELEIQAKREEMEADAERSDLELRGDGAVRAVDANRLAMEARLLESAVTQLRWQKERSEQLEAENGELRDEFASLDAERAKRGADHGERMHEAKKEMLQLRHQLELAFKRALNDKALLHYEAAFSALDPREKESLLQNAQLREELSLQRTGLDAVGRRVAEERVELAELLGDVRRLKDEESARAVAAAKLRHARDAAKSLAKRLAASLEALQAAREESVARSLDVLPEFSEETVRGFRDKEDDESTVASAQSVAELPKPTRSSERLSLAGLDNAPLPGGFKPSPGDEAVAIAQRERHLRDAEALCRKWAKRAAALRTVALDVRRGGRRPPTASDGAPRPPSQKLSREEEAAVDYARKSLDAHDDTFPDVTLDSRLFKATIRAWEDQDGDLARLAPVDPDSPFDTIGAIAASDGKPAASHARATGGRDEKRRAAPAPSAAPPRRRRGSLRQSSSANARSREAAPRVLAKPPAPLPKKAAATLAVAQLKALRALAKIELQQSRSDGALRGRRSMPGVLGFG
ncbi:hypothetical protein JL720_3563 [Aureococcus anophagefferens]|nr:hypothetical protein JL720_3563 [Aureococcus anophagefferens]